MFTWRVVDNGELKRSRARVVLHGASHAQAIQYIVSHDRMPMCAVPPELARQPRCPRFVMSIDGEMIPSHHAARLSAPREESVSTSRPKQ